MQAGARITLRGEAGCSEPGLAPGDVVLIIAPKEHSTFKRVGIDLIMTKKISLADALCGTTFHFKHLGECCMLYYEDAVARMGVVLTVRGAALGVSLASGAFHVSLTCAARPRRSCGAQSHPLGVPSIQHHSGTVHCMQPARGHGQFVTNRHPLYFVCPQTDVP